MKKVILTVILGLLLMAGCSSKQDTYQLNANEVIEKFEADDSFLLYFNSTSCSACQVFSPIYKEVRDDYPGYLYMIDYAEEDARNKEAFKSLLSEYTGEVKVTPTVLIVVDGEVAQIFTGIMKYSELENALKSYKMIR